jgi:hypothetical protein
MAFIVTGLVNTSFSRHLRIIGASLNYVNMLKLVKSAFLCSKLGSCAGDACMGFVGSIVSRRIRSVEFREHSGNIQGTFREHSGNIQGELSGRP